MQTETDAQFWRGDVSVSAASWSVAEARYALDLHEQGVLHESALLADAFSRDDRIPGCLDASISGFLAQGGLPFSMASADRGRVTDRNSIAKRFESLWYDWVPETELRGLLKDYKLLGVAHARKVWDTSTTPWTLRLEHWPAHGLRYDRAKDVWFTSLAGGVEEPVTPDKFFFLGSGRGRSWMDGAVLSLGEDLIGRIYTMRDWLRLNERHGMPILAISEPPPTGDAEQDRKQNAFFQRTVTLGSRGVLRLPQSGNKDTPGWDAKLLEVKDSSWQTFDQLLSRYDANIAIRLLGQNLSTEVKGGSFAAAQVHQTVARSLLTAMAEMLSTEFRRQVVMDYGRKVVASWSDALAPWPTWDLTPPADLQARATTMLTAIQAWALAKTSGLPLDPQVFANTFQLTLDEAALKALAGTKPT